MKTMKGRGDISLKKIWGDYRHYSPSEHADIYWNDPLSTLIISTILFYRSVDLAQQITDPIHSHDGIMRWRHRLRGGEVNIGLSKEQRFVGMEWMWIFLVKKEGLKNFSLNKEE